ncbi:uncharacterized protein [Nicotiana sylvestris]|uniref:Uncharacterized protein n=2 Tax=Nicotiana TaxID=4085 RepID=A0A1S3Z9X2_TOBAC|nr:PREDICTED: uncharacterized protein LOC104222799 [Nicotiana sylvestris]XP_009772398.1 PREDICTED: uncharacterized protein LOC104222799 [Nicotiana sylvestris]XP_016461178.1 PREDICTED: uncharacterized protein LOC107784543 [Nicotiana tabacum]
MEKANASKPVMQHPDSDHLSASSSDSSLELSTHPKESLGDLYTKSEPDASLSPSPAISPFPGVSSQTSQWSMMSNSPRAETGNPLFPDAFPQNLEPMKSPPSHSTMDHPPGYDPNRIPKSIFSSKPTTPEWSTASNESLFSIQMGTNSFSTDYSYLLSKSQELNKPEEWKNSPYYASEVKSNDSKNLSSPLPPLIGVSRDNDGKSARASEGPGIEKNVENPKMVSEEKPANNNIKEKTSNVIEEPAATTSNRTDERAVRTDDRAVPPTEATRISSPARTSSPCHSEASGNSSSSFAFPVLVNDGAKSNSLKGATEKVEKPQSQPEFQPEKQPQHKQSESQPKPAEKSWCSCFACWPRCC